MQELARYVQFLLVADAIQIWTFNPFGVVHVGAILWLADAFRSQIIRTILRALSKPNLLGNCHSISCMQETFMKVFLHQMGFGARPEYTYWAANNTHACPNTCFLVYLYGYLSTLIFLVSTGRRTGGEFLPFFDGLRQNRYSRPARPNECRFASYCRRTGIPHRLRTATARS